uniref:Immediate early response gene 5 protein-like n=1 Tax=Callorhinchus milii TaxID=7868 RepID=A0A4W3H018_CALMI
MDVRSEAQRVMAAALGKMYSSRLQRGGLRLHRSLLLSLVLRAARDVYLSGGAREAEPREEPREEVPGTDTGTDTGTARESGGDAGSAEGENGRNGDGVSECRSDASPPIGDRDTVWSSRRRRRRHRMSARFPPPPPPNADGVSSCGGAGDSRPEPPDPPEGGATPSGCEPREGPRDREEGDRDREERDREDRERPPVGGEDWKRKRSGDGEEGLGPEFPPHKRLRPEADTRRRCAVTSGPPVSLNSESHKEPPPNSGHNCREKALRGLGLWVREIAAY